MRKSSRKMLVTSISLALLAFSPALALAEEDASGNQAYGDASSRIHGHGIEATSIGASIQGGGNENVAVGSSYQVINGGSGSVAGIGALVVGGSGNTSIGSNSQVVDGNNLQATGYGAFSGHGDYNTAIGRFAYAGGLSSDSPSSYNTAIGNFSSATGGSSVAIGAYSSAAGYGSVALGAGSVAAEAGTVSVGNSDYQRRIVNVAPGIYDSDAATMGQLRSVGDRVNRVGASAAAFSALAPLPYDPKEPTQYAAGIGTYNGTGAVALGFYHYTKPDVMLNAAISISNDGWEKHARFGISWRTGGTKDKEVAPAVEAKEDITVRVKRILAESEKAE